MDFPVWQIPQFGGGMFIAFIAVVHVYVAHFAVGGGMFLALTELMGIKTQDPGVIGYVRRHTLFFLLLTMVFGSLTGVGIWFTIAIANPTATLTLIRMFTFGWATEWVFFLGEIITLLVYHYTFKTMDPKIHNRIGWLYFAFGFMSLFMINGIIGFMLTPGDWIATRDFWDGFFNPSFWPQLVFRFAMCLTIAGIFGFLTATWVRDDALRRRLTRFAAAWVALPFLVMVPAAWWYFNAVPQPAHGLIGGGNPEIAAYVQGLFTVGPLLILGAILAALRMPRPIKVGVAWVVLALGLVYIGSFEFIRESGRRPYVIMDYIWSTGVPVADAATIEEGGFLQNAKWVRHTEVTEANAMEAGQDLFLQQCLSCHSVAGPMNDIMPLTGHLGTIGMNAYLAGQGKLFKYMPPFMGTPQERDALAGYVVTGLHGREPDRPQVVDIEPLEHQIPSFDAESDEYVLLSWNTIGMKCITDADGFFSFLPPGNAMGTVLVRRGQKPQVVSEGVEIGYAAPEDMRNPAAHVDFWKYAPSLVGKSLPDNVSAAGKGLVGTMSWNDKAGRFAVSGIPLAPYSDLGTVNPYPLFDVTATETATGKILARTQAVLPMGTEMGCKTCHGGQWRKNGVTGIGDKTARGILTVHDKRNGTGLKALAEAGKPVLCQSCHPDPVLKKEGRPELLNLPAAMHGFHANYLPDLGDEVCSYCHPDSPVGVTRCLRDVHGTSGLGCSSCHGTLEDHATSLLKREQEKGKAAAARLMAGIEPNMASREEIRPRSPWGQEPDCMTCHEGYAPPVTDVAFNTWTEGSSGLYRSRMDEAGVLPCLACHGAPHAVYPAVNAYGADRDNVQPLQYQVTRDMLATMA